MSKIVAVVPVRKGSQRVISKNTRPFANTTLLDLKLEVLKKVKGIDEIIVNTDCEKCIQISKNHSISYYRRQDYFASSSITNDQHWKHLAEVTDTDILMMAQTTSPFIKVKTYEEAILNFKNSDGSFDSLNSVSIEKKFLWNENKPLNYNPRETPKSQDLPNIVSLNFGITMICKEDLLKFGNVVGQTPRFILLDKIESIDIDDQIDFDFAEFCYSKYGINQEL